MPGFDGTGPAGEGPMTGGSRGICNSATARHITRSTKNSGYGRGRWFGWGFRGRYGPGMRCGFGRGRWWNNPAYFGRYTEVNIDTLKAQADSVKNTLDAINSRITELENSSE